MIEDDQDSKVEVNCNWFGTIEVMKNEFEVLRNHLEGMENIWQCTKLVW